MLKGLVQLKKKLLLKQVTKNTRKILQHFKMLITEIKKYQFDIFDNKFFEPRIISQCSNQRNQFPKKYLK